MWSTSCMMVVRSVLASAGALANCLQFPAVVLIAPGISNGPRPASSALACACSGKA